jgi:Cyclin, N-terminal domain
MASCDSIRDATSEQVEPPATPAPQPQTSDDTDSAASAAMLKKPTRFGPRCGIAKSSSASPFIRERCLAGESPHSSRASALGAARKNAASNASNAPTAASPRSPSPEDRRRTPSPARRAAVPRHAPTHQQQPSSPAYSSGTMSHEIVRKVSSRSPLDGGAPADDAFLEAFIHSLQLVCDENETRADAAYPHPPHADPTPRDELIDAVFPIAVARRYSPDFLRHMQRHMRLSRRSLAAALVYLDRAHRRAGPALTICNKNVNTLVLSACVVASRVHELRGYSDEIVALAAGLGGATDVRRAVAFLLEALDWDVAVAPAATRPYERLLARLCEDGGIGRDSVAGGASREEVAARGRTLRMYYPPSALRQ